MQSMARDTIFALSSGRSPAAIAVVRLSGPQARFGLETMIGRVPEPRRAGLATVRDPETNQPIDQALALWFPGPRSETGEDMAELQLHGGRAVIAAVMAALGRLPGFRPAEAGDCHAQSHPGDWLLPRGQERARIVAPGVAIETRICLVG